MAGTANAIIPASQLDAPVSYEGLRAIGSGLGSAGFIVFDDTTDMAAVAAGVSRFLAVESCGQCEPCKLDGATLSRLLAKVSGTDAKGHDVEVIRHRITTVADRSRCFLATQQRTILSSIFDLFGDEIEAHVSGVAGPVEPVLIAELLDIRGQVAIQDEKFRLKQLDWTYNESDSGTTPVDFYRKARPPWLG
jgi:NADH:ubiquinone oxidoreductase subunit F (NADH-binding)